jgi:glycine/D-amino acid oxidase-like deaminating enzyme
MVLAEGIDRYSKMVNHEITSLQTSWAGLRTFSQDHALVIGFDKSTRDFFWFAGQGGYGFQTAPAASQLASELILSNSTSLAKGTIKALSPKRFN